MRVSVLNPDGSPAMPTKPSRARRWLQEGKAKIVYNELNIFCVQLILSPSGKDTQPLAVGIDPGKLYSGCTISQSNAVYGSPDTAFSNSQRPDGTASDDAA